MGMKFEKCECGKLLPLSGWRYCEHCGKKIEGGQITHHFRRCPNCEYIYPNTARYCVNCGDINEYLKNLMIEINEY